MRIAYHAVMIDETGCEFGASVTADDKGEAIDMLREDYPESAIAQIESPHDTREREAAMMRRLEDEMNGDY